MHQSITIEDVSKQQLQQQQLKQAGATHRALQVHYHGDSLQKQNAKNVREIDEPEFYKTRNAVIISIFITVFSIGLHFWYFKPMAIRKQLFYQRTQKAIRSITNFHNLTYRTSPNPNPNLTFDNPKQYLYTDPDTVWKIQRNIQDIITMPRLQEPTPQVLTINNLTRIKQQAILLNNTFQIAKALFQNSIKKQPNPEIDEVEYYIYNSKYNLDEPMPERRICVMSPFKNLLAHGTQNGSFNLFLSSFNSQNYSNYHVYMIDDASTDASTSTIASQLHKYPRLNNRITLLRNRKSMGALANRDSTTRMYCRTGDIVMDVDGDDALVGRQVFNFVNRLYGRKEEPWYIYTNFIELEGEKQGDGRKIALNISKASKGICKPIPSYIHARNSYRTELHFWMTSQLRTYLYDLYIKIPLSYLVDKYTGKYFIEASDRFTMYALVELAGPERTLWVDEYNYFYYRPNYAVLKTEKKSCQYEILFYSEAQSRILTPLKPLTSLKDNVQQVGNYTISRYILKYYLEKQLNVFECFKQKWKKFIYK